ncbi:MAG: hypothetical protein ACR2PR_09345 [Pseudohongiellaceae bacterium]
MNQKFTYEIIAIAAGGEVFNYGAGKSGYRLFFTVNGKLHHISIFGREMTTAQALVKGQEIHITGTIEPNFYEYKGAQKYQPKFWDLTIKVIGNAPAQGGQTEQSAPAAQAAQDPQPTNPTTIAGDAAGF